MQNFNLKNENGRSMIEMLGVLAIIGVLSVGGIAGYSKAMTKYRINKAIEQITLIAGNVRAFFAPQRNYVGIDCFCENGGCSSGAYDSVNEQNILDGCPIIKKAKILPDEMITLNNSGEITAITNPFGYDISLSYTDKSKLSDNQAFTISYYMGGDTEACIELLTHDWTTANIKKIEIASIDEIFRTPIDVYLAVTKCQKTVDENDISNIRFYFDTNL